MKIRFYGPRDFYKKKFWMVTLLSLFFSPETPANINFEHENTAAELILETKTGAQSQALLLDTDLQGKISGLIASLTLTQTFRNPSPEWVNGRYVFPLPEGASVDSLTLTTDDKILRGVVKEKEQAKKEFKAAKNAGKKAGLLQQHRPNLFSMSLANIPPNGTIVAKITWVETVTFDSGSFSLRLPTTLTPRFIPGKPVSNTQLPELIETELIPNQGMHAHPLHGWSLNTDQVDDASQITPWQISQPGHPGSHQFSLSLTLNSGIALENVTSATHAINVFKDEKSENVQHIKFANGTELLDRDLLIEWIPAANSRPNAAVFSQKEGENFHTLLMIMPPVQNIVQTLPREIIFIIDSSGSMAGVSMRQARQGLITALGYLSPADRFNIVDFDSTARALFADPVPATQNNLSRAMQFVSYLDPDGGTNMQSALNLAFSQASIENYLRQIVFITDGSVGNESALFTLIQNRLGDARLFTMGIGSAPNMHFMRGAAHYGRGSYSFIDSQDQAASRMNELFTKINRPVMQDIRIEWPGNLSVEAYPQKIPDLYIGEPLMLVAQSDQPLGKIEIEGTLAGNQWQRNIDAAGAPGNNNIDKIWARRKVDHLESQQVIHGAAIDSVKDSIIELGVNHQLVTRYTSFIAVEEERSRPVDQESKDKFVPNLMPRGNTMAVPVPNTATPATVQLLMGFLFLFMASVLWRASMMITLLRRFRLNLGGKLNDVFG
jgi:Ca-activated chloride channel family protein